MNIRTRLCFEISRRLMQPPAKRTVDYGFYQDWRQTSLSRSWDAFSDSLIVGKDVLDFGCGDGQLAFFLSQEKRPRKVIGVDINHAAIDRAKEILSWTPVPDGVDLDFCLGSTAGLPFPSESFDTLIAFDCLEHVMSLESILHEWYRMLRPGGRCVIEWYPYKGPWGPHMEALIPIPWAHVIFGERAMFRAAELIYDLPEFVPRHWDLDETGAKKSNKWRSWSSFEEQGYINKLEISKFRNLARNAGFEIERFEVRSFGGSGLRKLIGRTMTRIPLISEYFISFVAIELLRPHSDKGKII